MVMCLKNYRDCLNDLKYLEIALAPVSVCMGLNSQAKLVEIKQFQISEELEKEADCSQLAEAIANLCFWDLG